MALPTARGHNVLMNLEQASRLPFKLQDIIEELDAKESEEEAEQQEMQANDKACAPRGDFAVESD